MDLSHIMSPLQGSDYCVVPVPKVNLGLLHAGPLGLNPIGPLGLIHSGPLGL
jgi:hypothetical protein